MKSCKLDAYKMLFSVAEVCKENSDNNFIVAVSQDERVAVNAFYKTNESLYILAALVQSFKSRSLTTI